MFELLSQILLGLLVIWIIWFVLSRFVGQVFYTVLGVLALVAVIALAVLSPTSDGTVADIWQVLSLPFKPLGLSLILLLAAILRGLPAARGKFTEGGKFVAFNLALANAGTLVLAATLILLISSLPIVALRLTQLQEREGLSLTPQTSPPVGAIVLLGQDTIRPVTAANTIPGTTQVQLLDNRIPYTAQFYAEQVSFGARPIVIVCGDRRQGGLRSENTDAIGLLLAARGVPEGDIITGRTIVTRVSTEGADNVSQDRRREPLCDASSFISSADSVKQILNDRQLGNRVAVITNALTTYRVVKTFQNKGLVVVPRPTNFVALGVPPGRLLRRIVPSAEALAQTTRVTDEFLASLYYFIRSR